MKVALGRVVLAALFIVVPWNGVAGQEAPIVSVPFDGTEAFGHILHSFDLKPVPNFDDLSTLNPNKSLVIIFGDLAKEKSLSAAKKMWQALETFREQGGAILWASDYPDRGIHPFQLSNSGFRVQEDGNTPYKKEWECPFLHRFPEPTHPLIKGLEKGLATNRPSYLRANQSTLKCLAQFSENCTWLDGRWFNLPADAGYLFSSPQNTPPEGRVVALGGPGVFINGMLIQPDNDNFTFAWNTIRWLAEGPQGQREYALFINEGTVVNNFALPLNKFGPVPIPPIQVINRMIRGLEDENIFNRLLLDNNLGKVPYLRGLLILASLMVLFFGARKLINSRFRLDTGLPVIVGKQRTVSPAVSVLWQRQEELRRLGNLWEPAQVLARQFFLDHAHITVPLWDEETQPIPIKEVRGNFWQRRRLVGLVHKLWGLARSSPIRVVTPRQFDALLKVLADCTGAVMDKRIIFGPIRSPHQPEASARKDVPPR